LKNIFIELDKEKTGYLSVNVFIEVLKKNFNEEHAKQVADSVMSINQQTQNTEFKNLINWKEFLSPSKEYNKGDLSKTGLMVYFSLMDTNNDGFLDRKEIGHGYKLFFGENLNSIEIDDVIENADKNGDGKLDFLEFINYVLK